MAKEAADGYNVERFFMEGHVDLHPDYEPLIPNKSISKYDMAVVTLRTPVNLDEHPNIKPACLPTKPLFPKSDPPRDAIASGWGSTEYNTSSKQPQSLASELLFTKVDIIGNSNIACHPRSVDSVPGSSNASEAESTFCAMSNVCRGDSGGPLVEVDDKGRYTLRGIASYGNLLCGISEPGGFVDVSKLLLTNDDNSTSGETNWLKRVLQSQPGANYCDGGLL